MNVGWGHPVNVESCKQRQKKPLFAFGGAFPIQNVPVSSFQLVNSRGRKDGNKEEMRQLLAKPHCVGTGAFSQGQDESLKLF